MYQIANQLQPHFTIWFSISPLVLKQLKAEGYLKPITGDKLVNYFHFLSFARNGKTWPLCQLKWDFLVVLLCQISQTTYYWLAVSSCHTGKAYCEKEIPCQAIFFRTIIGQQHISLQDNSGFDANIFQEAQCIPELALNPHILWDVKSCPQAPTSNL